MSSKELFCVFGLFPCRFKRWRAKLLSMFGTLISPKLRAAQLSFETALETLVEIANMRSAMLSSFDRVRKELDHQKDDTVPVPSVCAGDVDPVLRGFRPKSSDPKKPLSFSDESCYMTRTFSLILSSIIILKLDKLLLEHLYKSGGEIIQTSHIAPSASKEYSSLGIPFSQRTGQFLHSKTNSLRKLDCSKIAAMLIRAGYGQKAVQNGSSVA
uniref:Vacuolar ATPase assembly protein VMA22 n=1 Tax=Salix viminalis TaxID=40686 RepID=A0A6N2LEF8_SALVM